MATAQTLLNNVLRGLRRDVVSESSTTNSYNILLIQFLNQARQEIEELWDWHALRTIVTITLSANTTEYELTAAGPADVDVGERARLLYELSRPGNGDYIESTSKSAGALAQVFDVTDAVEHRLTEITPEEYHRLILTDDDETATAPTYFAIWRDSDAVTMGVYPAPDGTRTLKARFVNPQADIANTGLTSYTLSIPSRPVWLRALLTALGERGETDQHYQDIGRDAENALYNAMDRERGEQDNTGYPV